METEQKEKVPIKKIVIDSEPVGPKTSNNLVFKNISLSILTGLVIAGLFSVALYALATAWPYTPPAPLEPGCLPTDLTCIVKAPLTDTFTTDFSGSGNLTTTGTITAGTLKVGSAYTLPTADGTSGYVLTTDGSGNITWQAGGGASVWNRDNGTKNLYPTTAGDGLYIPGTTGTTPTSGAGTRLMWIPAKAALRAGIVSDSRWDDAYIGANSIALGNGARASGASSVALLNGQATGDISFAVGGGTHASGYYSTAMGGGTTASSDYTTATGLYTTASGQYSASTNYYTTASGVASTATGIVTTAQGYGQTVIGMYNVVAGTPGSRVNSEYAFVIGNGTGTGISASNALTVDWTGNLNAANSIITGTDVASGSPNVAGSLKLWSAGDNAYSTTFTAGTQTGNVTYTLPLAQGAASTFLQNDGSGTLSWAAGPSSYWSRDTMSNALYPSTANDGLLVAGTFGIGGTPASGAGTRLMWVPALAAFRAGYVGATQWDSGNIGSYSVAMGQSTTASNYASTAMGGSTTASGQYGTAMGNGTTASGTGSTAMGFNTIASGNFSTAMGQSTTASNDDSTAMGVGTTASGYLGSMATGSGTIAQGFAQTVIGSYNIASGNIYSMVGSDFAFIIGNGAGTGSESNALTVDWTGNLNAANSIITGTDVAGGSPNVAGSLKLWSAGDNAYSTTFTAGTQTADASYTLPTSSSDGLLKNTSGTLSWDSTSFATSGDLAAYVPYTGATTNVNLGAHNLTIDTNTLFVDSTNHKVGIGTTTPIGTLHVYNTTGINAMNFETSYNGPSGAYTGFFHSRNNLSLNNGDLAGGLYFFGMNSGNAYGDGTPGNYTSDIANIFAQMDSVTQGSESGNLQFWTRSAGVRNEKMRITAAGNVGIGASSPNQKLTVNGTFGILEGGASPTYHTIFQGGDQAGDITYTLPTAQGGASTVLQNDGSGVLSWVAAGVGAHNLLSSTHGDTTAGAVARGDLITGQGASPTWTKLAFPATPTGKILQATATDVAWSTNALTIGASASVSGSNTGDQTITLTSDVTGSGTGSFATTIAAGAVTLGKMANLAANSIIGNNTGSAATPIALSASDVKTLLSLNNVTNDAQIKASIGTTQGDLITFSGASTPVRIAAGTSGYVLTSNGAGTQPTWQAAAGGSGVWTRDIGTNNLYPTTNGDGLYIPGTIGTTPTSGAGTRLMWVPARGAFRAGIVGGTEWNDANIGTDSVAMGHNTTASGNDSVALGYGTTASQDYTTAMGNSTTASAISSTAMGDSTTASGQYSTAIGYSTTAQAYGQLVIGMFDAAGGTAGSRVNTEFPFVIGNGTSGGSLSNALTVDWSGNVVAYGTVKVGNAYTLPATDGTSGYVLTTNGSGAVSWVIAPGSIWSRNVVNNYVYPSTPGDGLLVAGITGVTPVSGAGARLMWVPSKQSIRAGYVTGDYWDAANIGDTSVAMGYNVKASGHSSVSFGDSQSATGDYSASIGTLNTASGNNSMAFGYSDDASAVGTVALGWDNTASGTYSTAMGYASTASANGSTAIGVGVTASGQYSTAMGDDTAASGEYSTALGYSTTAQAYNQVVIGMFDAAGGTAGSRVNSEFPFVIGNGTSGSLLSNALTVDWNGNLTAYGTVRVGNAYTLPASDGTSGYVLTTNGSGAVSWVAQTGGSGVWSRDATNKMLSPLTPGDGLYIPGTTGVSPATLSSGSYFMWIPAKSALRAGPLSSSSWDYANIGSGSVGLGQNTKASGVYSTALGYITTATGDYGSTALGNNTLASGQYGSTALGYYTTASGQYGATAIGEYTTASGDSSFASGYYASASGNGSVASGDHATASGQFSSATGSNTLASGYYSRAIGLGTKAQGYAQQAIGAYNIASGTGTSRIPADYLFIIGGGNDDTSRSNAMTVDWYGDVTASQSLILKPLAADPSAPAATEGELYYNSGSHVLKLYNGAWVTVTTSSSLRFKHDIQPLTDDWSKILQVQPKSFVYNGDTDTQVNIGYIAEDFDALGLKDLVQYDDKGRPSGINYDKISLYNTEVLKQQQIDINAIKLRLGMATDTTVAINPAGSSGSGSVIGVTDQSVQTSLTNLGATLSGGIMSLKEIIVDKMTANTAAVKYLQMTATNGDIYCTWIDANGDWQKVKGNCDSVATATLASTAETTTAPAETVSQASSQQTQAAIDIAQRATDAAQEAALQAQQAQQAASQAQQSVQQVQAQVQSQPQAANITSVASVPDITVEYGTELASANLPATLNVTLSDSTNQTVMVIWDSGIPTYDAVTPGTYVFTGTLTFTGNITNTTNIKAMVNVIVLPQPEPTITSGSTISATSELIRNTMTGLTSGIWDFIKWIFGSGKKVISYVPVLQSATANLMKAPTLFQSMVSSIDVKLLAAGIYEPIAKLLKQ